MSVWKKDNFEDFRKGSFGNGGQNIYVSKKGILQRIFQYDITGNGYPDLLFANSQSMGERPPLYAFSDDAFVNPSCLRSRGSFEGTMADITGNGTMDLIVACQHDGVTSDVTSMIYYSSPEGYTEKYMTELAAPGAISVAAGDFRKTGRCDIAFAGNGRIRLFEQTELGIEPTCYRDIEINAISLCSGDLDGDGYDDLYVLTKEGRMYIYWGGADGLNKDRYTLLPQIAPVGNESSTSTAGRINFASILWNVSVLKLKGKMCIFRREGEYAAFDYFDSERHPKNLMKIDAKDAKHATSGSLISSGNDLFVSVSNDLNNESESFILTEKDNYNENKKIVVKTRGARTATISPIERNGKNCLFVAQTSTRRDNDVNSLMISFDSEGNIDVLKEIPGHCTMRICIGDSGLGDKYQAVFINHESGRWSGEENIHIYIGDEDGYKADRRIELPGLSTVEGHMIDFTDNGFPDVLAVCCAENQPNLCTGLYIYHNEGKGPEIDKREDVGAALPHGVAIGDFRHSGYLDIAVGGIHSREIYIYEGSEDGYSDERMKKIVFGPNEKEFVPFDWSTIDNLDAKVYSDEEQKLIRDYGEFRWMFTADLNGDGYLDLIIPLIVGPHCYILWGGKDGFSTDNMQILAADGVGCVNVADLNGNGYPDLILGGHQSTKKNCKMESYITIYWNGPDGFKENRKTCLPAWCVNSLSIADFNADGVLDIYATSYSNGRVRDLDSFIYYGDKEKGFSVDRRDRLFNNSASGCLAGDFNHDGYVDLAVGSHKKEGNHVCDSFVYWGGPDGIKEDRKTTLPTVGVHGMSTVDIGNIMDRSGNEYYYSEIYEMPEEKDRVTVNWKATMGSRCNVWMQIRCSDTVDGIEKVSWSENIGNGETIPSSILVGKYMQYRLNLFAQSGCGTPRVSSVEIHFE